MKRADFSSSGGPEGACGDAKTCEGWTGTRYVASLTGSTLVLGFPAHLPPDMVDRSSSTLHVSGRSDDTIDV